MTTDTQSRVEINPLSGTNVGPFNTVWTYEVAGEVGVYLEVDGVETKLSLGTDYTVTGATPLISGGAVTLEADLVPSGGWVSGSRLILRGETILDQPRPFGSVSQYQPKATEEALDKLTRITQEQAGRLSRALVFAAGETGFSLPAASARASRFLAFDALGAVIMAAGIASVPVSSFAATMLDDTSAKAVRQTLLMEVPTSGIVGAENTQPIFEAEFALSPAGRNVHIGIGQNRTDSGISHTGGPVTLTGEGAGAGPGAVQNSHCSQILAGFASGHVISVGPTLFGSRFEHFQINTNTVRTSGAGLYLNGSNASSVLGNTRVNNVCFVSQYRGIHTLNAWIGVYENMHHFAWKYQAFFQEGDGVNEGATGSVCKSVFFGDGAPGATQDTCLTIKNGYAHITDNLVLGAKVGCKFIADTYPAGAFEYWGNWTEEQSEAGFYAINGSGVAASMLAVNWGEYAVTTFSGASRSSYQGAVVFAAGAAPWLSTTQVIGNRARMIVTNASGGVLNLATGTGMQVSLNNIEGVTAANTMKGIIIGAQAGQTDVFDNMIRGYFGAKYLINNTEVMFRDFSSRLIQSELSGIVVHDGSMAWAEDGKPGVLAGFGNGCVAIMQYGAWIGLDPRDNSFARLTTDADFTLDRFSASNIHHVGGLTANRTITLGTPAYAGQRRRITRSGGGAFTLSVGGVVGLATNTWCEVIHDGVAWVKFQYGTI